MASFGGIAFESSSPNRRSVDPLSAPCGFPRADVPSSGPMEIRDLPEDRFDEAVALWRDAELTRPWNDPEADLRRALDGPSSTVLVVVEDGELVATAMVGHDGHRGWIYYLAVRNAARRRGLGAALVGACERWLAERDVPKVNLMIRGDNTAAAGFYDALGYAHDDVVVRSRRLDA